MGSFAAKKNDYSTYNSLSRSGERKQASHVPLITRPDRRQAKGLLQTVHRGMHEQLVNTSLVVSGRL